MDRWLNGLKAHAGAMDMNAARTRLGTVMSYDPVNAAVKVQIQPEGVLSGWLPLGCAAVGPSAILAPPNPGDQVVLEAQEGDGEHWIISHRLFSTAAMPPASPGTGQAVQSGEVAIFHQSGGYMHFANNGTVYGKAAANWRLAGDIHLTGTLYVSGDVVDINGTHGSLNALRAAYDAHHHTGVQPGGGTTGLTDDPV